MKLSKKTLLVMFVFVVLLVPLGQLSAVHADQPLPQTLEAKAFACLTDVYPVDLNHYNVTFDAIYTLSSASDTSTTQAVNYKLNSPDSNLVADFLFKNGVLYQLSLSVINGSVATAQPYDNLTDEARDFLVKYQAFSGVDSTDLIRLLNHFEDTNMPVTLGNTSLNVSHLAIPNVENGTTFHWNYRLNGPDDISVSLTFDNSTFGSFFDSRQLYTVGSTEAISTAINYIENYSYIAPDGAQVNGFKVSKEHSVAEFFTSPRNGNALYPCWNVTLNLNQTYPRGVNAFLVEVRADSGEVFNCRNQAVASVQVNESNMDSTLIVTPAAIAAVTIAVVIIVMRRRK